MASFGFMIAQIKLFFKIFVPTFFFFFPSTCSLTGNCSLRGGPVNPAGHGEITAPNSGRGRQSHAPNKKPRQNTESLCGPPGMQHMRRANGRLDGGAVWGWGGAECNTTWEEQSVGPSEGVAAAFATCSHIKRGEGWAARGGAGRRGGTTAYGGRRGNGTVNGETCYLFYWWGLLRRRVRWDWSQIGLGMSDTALCWLSGLEFCLHNAINIRVQIIHDAVSISRFN